MFRICRALAISCVLLIGFHVDTRTTAVTAVSPLPANPVSAPANAVPLSRTGWTAVADSAQPGNEANYALDGDTDTFWHTEWDPVDVPMPHNITIDMKTNYIVHGVCYTPRQDGNSNGNFGGHAFYLSTDDKTWGSPVAHGTWVDDANQKCTYFSGTSCRYMQFRITVEAGNRGPWASAAEIQAVNVPGMGDSLSRTKWVVTADSFETISEPGQPQNAIDGNPDTIWHTQYTNTLAPLPHTFTIDQTTSVSANGLTYRPRPGGGNGNIGNYVVQYSTNNSTWKNLTTGQWADDATLKSVSFALTTARYFRLIALTEAGNRGPWTSAAEINLVYSTSYTFPNNTLGRWGPTIDFPSIPVAAAVLKDGTVMTWSSYSPYYFSGSPGTNTITSIYYPATGQVSQDMITDSDHDMFCPGSSIDFLGRLFVTGGNSGQQTSMYDPTQGNWFAMGQMNFPRGYHAQTTLSDGRIFVIGGSWTDSGDPPLKNGEIYDPASNTWTLLPECLVAPMLTDDDADNFPNGIYRSDNHGWLFSWKNGYVFQAGPSAAMNWYNTTGDGNQSSAGSRASDGNAMCGNAIMYDATQGKILTVGGSPNYQDTDATANAHIITIATPGALANVTTINSMSFPRQFANAVVLPDGTVFITGGQTYPVPFSDDTAVFNPELWNPVTNKFTTLNPNTIPRVYHSVALLLPDATVFCGGGGLCGDPCDANHFDAEIFTPPYLFNSNGTTAVRPVITTVSPTVLSLSGTNIFSVTTSQTTGNFSLIRMGSTTHTVNTDQRRISLIPTSTNGLTYTLTCPTDPGIAIPGYWMLFALNANGVPSVAKIMQITL